MLRPTRRLAPAVLALVLGVGAGACGGDVDPTSGASPTPATTTPGATPSSTPTSTPPGTLGSTPGGDPTSAPAVGVPAGFPVEEVPLLGGLVTGKTGGDGPDGRKGWVLELSATGTQQSCFAEASAALVAAGFTKQGEITAADTRQAQFTSPEYAVILSVRADGSELCQASYEVGQVAG